MDREEFRKAVFDRDGNKCVVPGCSGAVQDAHHIIERSLWTDPSEEGGYILDNGVSVCGVHHIHAEKNFIPPQAFRYWAHIGRVVLPKGLDPKNIYDKWGKVAPRPNRVQIKYPHTPYLPFSPSVDEKDLADAGYADVQDLVQKPLVATVKMDGSNSTWTTEKVAARNAHDAPHKSFDLAKARHAKLKHMIPSNLQLFGEWLYARHSIHYQGRMALGSLFQLFGVYDRDYCLWLEWAAVEHWARVLGVETVPVVERMECAEAWELEKRLTEIGAEIIRQGHEGLVVRSAYPFHWGDFSRNVVKFVRRGHVVTSEHWQYQSLVKNEVRK